MVGTEGSEAVKWSQSQKTDRSPDCSLQLDCMKSESLVIADQHAAVNRFTRRRLPNRKEGGDHGGFHDWGEVVTR